MPCTCPEINSGGTLHLFVHWQVLGEGGVAMVGNGARAWV